MQVDWLTRSMQAGWRVRCRLSGWQVDVGCVVGWLCIAGLTIWLLLGTLELPAVASLPLN
jgi:hypothetical protein